MIDSKILEEAKQAVIQLDENAAAELIRRALDEGADPMELMEKGFIPGITEVGNLFGRGQMFLPELVTAAEVMRVAGALATEAMPQGTGTTKGVVAIATVKGDVHDIGKSIVVAMFKANGYKVHDLGRDVAVDAIIDGAVKHGAVVIGTSALLTTTMAEQRKLEDELRKAGLRDTVKTVVGGAPVTARWAKRIGADAYAEDAQDGILKVAELLTGRQAPASAPK